MFPVTAITNIFKKYSMKHNIYKLLDTVIQQIILAPKLNLSSEMW